MHLSAALRPVQSNSDSGISSCLSHVALSHAKVKAGRAAVWKAALPVKEPRAIFSTRMTRLHV